MLISQLKRWKDAVSQQDEHQTGLSSHPGNRFSLRGFNIWWIDAQRNGSSGCLNRNYNISGAGLSRETLNSRQSLPRGMCAITDTILLTTTCKLNFPSVQPTSLNIRAPQKELQCLTRCTLRSWPRHFYCCCWCSASVARTRSSETEHIL